MAVASSGLLDPAKLGKLVVERARGLLAGDEATLVVYDETVSGLRVLADTHVPPYTRVIGVGEGASGMAFERGEAVSVEDYPGWEHAVKDSLPRGLMSVVATPLLVRSQPIGALTVSFNKMRRLGEDDHRLLALLATQVAPAIEAARLHDALTKLSHDLEESNTALQEADRHKSVFLANMSHELRTPLNAIIGFSELLVDSPEGQFDNAARRRFSEQILMAGRHLLALINDILDLSKVQSGQMELNLQPVKVAELIGEVATGIEPLVAKKHLGLHQDRIDPGTVIADRGKLKQMLLNLISNAIKFTPEGGEITISTARQKSTLEISVADTGIGISDVDQKKLFREFEQLDQGSGRRQEGTGLGLALTRRLAMLHGGDVRVGSVSGKGSVFTILIPLRTESTHVSTASGPLVLIVEDESAAAELLTRQLNDAGFRTHVVRDGLRAVAEARNLRPAAITVDVILPGIDGWEVIRRLKLDEATRDIPTIVVSVVDRPELGLTLGAIDYFVKPFDTKELVRRIGRLAESRKPGRSRARVLIVDDLEANLEWMRRALTPVGFDVIAASGGKQAIELARETQPDLVLLDLMMPEVSGFDVVTALRSDEGTCETPIMVVTSADLTETDKRVLSGRVSRILDRGSIGAPDLVGLLRRAVKVS